MSQLEPLSQQVLASLARFDTPTICNVLELFENAPRTGEYLDGRIQSCFPKLPPMVGYAVTATFRAGAPSRKTDGYAGLDQQVDELANLAGPKIVVFQDLDDPMIAATFGEVMCTTYQAFGCVGLITSGAGRDLDQVEALGFPCFTGGTISSHGYCQIAQTNLPVRVGGVWVLPGDLLHGDRNGVTRIPIHRAGAIADACPVLMAAESVVLEYLKRPTPTAAGYKAARAECHRQIQELSAKLSAG